YGTDRPAGSWLLPGDRRCRRCAEPPTATVVHLASSAHQHDLFYTPLGLCGGLGGSRGRRSLYEVDRHHETCGRSVRQTRLQPPTVSIHIGGMVHPARTIRAALAGGAAALVMLASACSSGSNPTDPEPGPTGGSGPD